MALALRQVLKDCKLPVPARKVLAATRLQNVLVSTKKKAMVMARACRVREKERLVCTSLSQAAMERPA